VGQLDAVAPQNARDLLSMLAARGLLSVRTCSARASGGPPPIFGRPSAASHVAQVSNSPASGLSLTRCTDAMTRVRFNPSF
jgi:hypothetical protein